MKYSNISYPDYIEKLTEKLSSVELNSLPSNIIVKDISKGFVDSSSYSEKYSSIFF